MIKRRNGPERWLPKGGLKGLRETLTPTDEQRAILENLPPPKEGDFSVEFADSVAQREIDLAHEADAAAKAAAQRARENPLEATVQARIRKALEARGWRVMRRGVGVVKDENGRIQFTYGESGEADLECLPGRGITTFIEVKRPGEHAKPHQAKWLEAMRERGYVAGVAHSPEEAIALVEEALR